MIELSELLQAISFVKNSKSMIITGKLTKL